MAGWTEIASADNAEVTATKAAAAEKQHIIYGVSASFTTTVTKLLQIKDGSTVIWEAYVYDTLGHTFPEGIAATKGNAVSVVLAASGAGGNLGKVNLHGTTF